MTSESKNRDLLPKVGREWKNSYTWVLLANVIYFVIFYFIMKTYA